MSSCATAGVRPSNAGSPFGIFTAGVFSALSALSALSAFSAAAFFFGAAFGAAFSLTGSAAFFLGAARLPPVVAGFRFVVDIEPSYSLQASYTRPPDP